MREVKKIIRRVDDNRLCAAVLVLFSILAMLQASLGELRYDEIDSITLPTVSIQYRGTIVINQSDIETAGKDFPSLYQGVHTYDDLRSTKLRKITDEDWLAFYFPVYPAACIPVKLLLDGMGLPQERAFSVTNALLMILAMSVAYRGLRATGRQKLLALLLLAISPISHYINYICYEAFMFAMVTISMVCYQRGNYKTSAFFLALAGQCNATAMAAGFVMIAHYFVKIFAASKGKTLLQIIKENFWETLRYAVVFTPCFANFIVLRIYAVKAYGNVGSLAGDYGARLLSYFFDPNLGFVSFAPLQMLFVLVSLVLIWRKRAFGAIVWPLFLLADVLAFSIWDHINCGMIYCARYLVWTYPILAIFIAVCGIPLLAVTAVKAVTALAMLGVSAGLFWINGTPEYVYLNTVSTWLLDNIPAVYSPYRATFYSRVLHIDAGYDRTSPAYYLDSQGEDAGQVRKLLYQATEANVQQLLTELTGTEASLDHLKDQLEDHGLDNEYHYITLSPEGAYQLRKKTEAEKWAIRTGDTLVQKEPIALNWTGSYYETFYPITLESERDYQITLQLPENFNFDNTKTFFVDFYAYNGYDHPQQEVMNFQQEGTYDYLFTVNAGKLESGSMEAYFRIICFPKEYSGEPLHIDTVEVREVEEMTKIELSQADLDWIRSLA